MKKGITSIMIANIICLIISLLTNIILPKFLSVESYAQIKVYALYISYAGFFTMGYNDGMYLKYGGKEINEIKKDDIRSNFSNYTALEIVMLIVVISVGMLFKNALLVTFAFGLFANNELVYLKTLYQATGEFKEYSFALNVEKIVVFLGNVALIFLLKTDNYFFYVWIQIIAGLIIMAYMTGKLDKKTQIIGKPRLSFEEIKGNVCSGFILMLGNFSSTVFTGIDRWFVNILLGTVDFAFYSFAVSMENLINVFMTPITVSMYNYFCGNHNLYRIYRIKNKVLIWGFMVISAAFPAKWILEHYITNYIGASSVIFLLFATQAFYVVIKGIYVNIYKAEKRQNKYLKQMIEMMIVAFVLNTLLYYILKSKEAIAFATFITGIIWLIICESQYQQLRFRIKEIISILILLSVYLFAGYKLSSEFGFLLYCATGLTVGLTLMREDFIELIKYMFSFIFNHKNSI